MGMTLEEMKSFLDKEDLLEIEKAVRLEKGLRNKEINEAREREVEIENARRKEETDRINAENARILREQQEMVRLRESEKKQEEKLRITYYNYHDIISYISWPTFIISFLVMGFLLFDRFYSDIHRVSTYYTVTTMVYMLIYLVSFFFVLLELTNNDNVGRVHFINSSIFIWYFIFMAYTACNRIYI